VASAPERDRRPEIERAKERAHPGEIVEQVRIALHSGRRFAELSEDLQLLAKWVGVYPALPLEDGRLMMRIRVTNGFLVSEQLARIGQVANRYGGGLADITVRQCVQLHHLEARDLPAIWRDLEGVGLGTTHACGDVWRNVVGCPLAGVTADELFDASPAAGDLVRAMVGPAFDDLPRKFKVSVSACRHRCAQHEINDLGFVGVIHPRLGPGFDVWVGGGLGTSARLARRLDVFAAGGDVVDVACAVTYLYQRNGDRAKRTRARVKWLVDKWGPECYRARVCDLLERDLPRGVDPGPAILAMRDHIGVTPQAEAGLYALGGASLRGRTSGDALMRLADVAARFGQGRVRLTNRQNLILLDVPEQRVSETAQYMSDFGFPVHGTSSFRRQTVACTGIEFCRLAVSETKEVARGVIEHLERTLGSIPEPSPRVNVNGCPNACCQYQLADVGLQGALARASDGSKVMGFQIHLGGRLGADARFAVRTARPVPAEEARFVVERILGAYRDERYAAEEFSSWIDRQEPGRMEQMVGGRVNRVATEAE
jgi:sulfite reductase (ferredoxin)